MVEGARLVRFRGVECLIDDAGQTRTVTLAGEIDISVADELGAWLSSSAEGYDTLALDLSNITFMDSTGLHLLIRLKRELGGHFWLSAVSQHVQGLLGVTGLSKFFD